MTSPLDLVSLGLGQASGLSLVSQGLLIVHEINPILVPGAGSAPAKIDVRLRWDLTALESDVTLTAGDLEPENGLATALLLSLFTDAPASDEQLARFGGDDRHGWCLDSLAATPGDRYGSLLWLLQREAQTTENLNFAREAAEQATRWFVTDGVLDEVIVQAEYPQRGLLALQLELVRARAPRERFAFVWGV